MRTLVLAAIGLGLSISTLPCQTIQAQDGGRIAQLSSAAYAPDSPVRENQLFRYQTGHYGFAYNCDREEDKRNNPAICWRNADQCQLPKRMSCMERVRHEVAQVSRRILDGMCDSECEPCRLQRRSASKSCSCEACLAKQNATIDQTTQANGLLAAQQSSAQEVDSAKEVEQTLAEVLVGAAPAVPVNAEVVQPAIEPVQRPVAKITSAIVDSGMDSVLETASPIEQADAVAEVSPPSPSSSTHQMSLSDRLKKVQTAQATDLSKPAKF